MHERLRAADTAEAIEQGKVYARVLQAMDNQKHLDLAAVQSMSGFLNTVPYPGSRTSQQAAGFQVLPSGFETKAGKVKLWLVYG